MDDKKRENEIEESNALKVIKGTNQKIEAEEPTEEIKKASKWENFWYHNKWHAGITIGVIIIAAVLLVQLLTNVTPDAYIMYAGPGVIIGTQYDKLEEKISSLMEDSNGDGHRKISFADNTYLTKEQQDARKAMGLQVNTNDNSAAYDRYIMELSAGEHMICLLDPGLYESARISKMFVPLSDIFDDVPECALDGYGINFGETEFYKENGDIQFIPNDTVMALRVPAALALKSDEEKEKYFEAHRELFRAIVLYTAPNDK